MKDEKPLTLEEITALVETVKHWRMEGWTMYCAHNYRGLSDNLLQIESRNLNFFGLPWSRNREITVTDGKAYCELGSVRGKEAWPLYLRIRELYEEAEEKRYQEKRKQRNQRLRELRKNG